jgi:hypothetical protein
MNHQILLGSVVILEMALLLVARYVDSLERKLRTTEELLKIERTRLRLLAKRYKEIQL